MYIEKFKKILNNNETHIHSLSKGQGRGCHACYRLSNKKVICKPKRENAFRVGMRKCNSQVYSRDYDYTFHNKTLTVGEKVVTFSPVLWKMYGMLHNRMKSYYTPRDIYSPEWISIKVSVVLSDILISVDNFFFIKISWPLYNFENFLEFCE